MTPRRGIRPGEVWRTDNDGTHCVEGPRPDPALARARRKLQAKIADADDQLRRGEGSHWRAGRLVGLQEALELLDEDGTT